MAAFFFLYTLLWSSWSLQLLCQFISSLLTCFSRGTSHLMDDSWHFLLSSLTLRHSGFHSLLFLSSVLDILLICLLNFIGTKKRSEFMYTPQWDLIFLKWLLDIRMWSIWFAVVWSRANHVCLCTFMWGNTDVYKRQVWGPGIAHYVGAVFFT